MSLVEAYFDESGSHDGSPVLCVAGYIYEKRHAVKLDAEWKEALDRFSLPYFHMVDCAHGNPPFDALSMEERIDVQKRMIEIIKRHMSQGNIVWTRERLYDKCTDALATFGGAYTWCCYMCLVAVHTWAEDTNFDGEIAYFFEAGHKYQKQANALMHQIAKIPEIRRSMRYASHSFVDKVQARPIQSADILAWHGAVLGKRLLEGNTKMRADFITLCERDTHYLEGDAEEFMAFQRRLTALPPSLRELFYSRQ
jgi:uncharacterized protein DUF3800